jgi:hypothetical protein
MGSTDGRAKPKGIGEEVGHSSRERSLGRNNLARGLDARALKKLIGALGINSLLYGEG